MSSKERQPSPSSSNLFSKKQGLNVEKKHPKKSSERKNAKKPKLERPQHSVMTDKDSIGEMKVNEESKDSNTEVVTPENIGDPMQEEETEQVTGNVLLQQDLVADSQYDEIIQPSLTPDIKQIHIPKVIPHDSIHPVVADTFEQHAINEPSVG